MNGLSENLEDGSPPGGSQLRPVVSSTGTSGQGGPHIFLGPPKVWWPENIILKPKNHDNLRPRGCTDRCVGTQIVFGSDERIFETLT